MPAVVIAALLAAAPWQKVSDEDGFLLEAQEVDGSSFENLRVTCTTSVSPETFAKAQWGKSTDTSASPEIAKRTLFVDEASERLYYELIKTPIVSDRDFVMHETITSNDATGAWTVKFDTVTDKRGPEVPGVVRMPKVAGTVVATPAEKGAKVVYNIFTDVGGAVPAVFTRATQRKNAVTWLKEIRRRAEAPKPR
jgi:hypothetical protein